MSNFFARVGYGRQSEIKIAKTGIPRKDNESHELGCNSKTHHLLRIDAITIVKAPDAISQEEGSHYASNWHQWLFRELKLENKCLVATARA